jgi:glycosyltransferase involved in cell wall biosynthesis
LYSDIAKYVDKKSVFYCPNGIPEVNEGYSACRNHDGTTKTCQILFLSNMVKEKGLFVLLDACKILNERKMPFKCDFVGSWPEVTKEQVQTRVEELGLSQHVMLHDKKFGADKTAFFKNADVFVFPTFYHNECFPLVNLEAMQFALPLITTCVGGIPDMVVDNESGFLIPPMNSAVLADKLEILISNPHTRKTMGLAGRKLYEKHYTLKKFELSMGCILEEAIRT